MTNPADDRASAATALTHEIVAEVAARKQAQDRRSARAGRRAGRRIPLAVPVTLVITCVVLTALNLSGRLSLDPPTAAAPATGERERQLRRTLNFAVREIDQYRAAHGEPPPNLTAVGAPTDVQWTYLRHDDGGYSISVADGTLRAEYDSAQNPDAVFSDVRQR